MKIALYIEDGRSQIVLTPANETEKGILQQLQKAKDIAQIHKGSFYGCQGGWTRHGSDDQSTIIVIDKQPLPHTQG